jgi:hypothetical protein
MYWFQDGSEVISIKREATDTQQEQEKSAVAITLPEINAEEEVSCISLYPLVFGFSNPLSCQNTFVLCHTHDCTQYVHLNLFQTSARDTETFHVLSFIATELFPYHMFGLPFPLNCFQSTSYVCILCTFPRCVKITHCNFNSFCVCSNTQLWPLWGVCKGKNDGSEGICDGIRYVKVFWIVSAKRYFISWENPGTCLRSCFDPQPNVFRCISILSFKMLWWPVKLLSLWAKLRIVVCCFEETFLHLILFICFHYWRLSIAFGILCGLCLLNLENPFCIAYSPKMHWVLQKFA